MKQYGGGGGLGGLVTLLMMKEFWISLGIAILTFMFYFEIMIVTGFSHFQPFHIINYLSQDLQLKFLKFIISAAGIILIILTITFIILFAIQKTRFIISKIIFSFCAVLTVGLLVVHLTTLTLFPYAVPVIFIMGIIYVIMNLLCWYPIDMFLQIANFFMLLVPLFYVLAGNFNLF